MEIVTKPDLQSPAEAQLFLQELQKILRTLGVSDADMEKGQMRCDANISLKEVGGELHPKTEIKNVNSFKFVAKALAYEIERQTKLWAEGKPPATQSTRGYNSTKNETYEQRGKEAAADYRYFPDPDLPPFEFSEEELGAVRASLPELPLAKQTRFMQEMGIAAHQAELLVGNRPLADFYEATVSELLQLNQEHEEIKDTDILELKTLAAKVVLRQLRAVWPSDPEAARKITPENFAELIALLYQGKINKEALEPILKEMLRTGGDPDPIIAKLGLQQMGGEDDLTNVVQEVLAANPDVVAKVKAGKQGALQFLMGQVMKKTQGTANPSAVQKLLQTKIDN